MHIVRAYTFMDLAIIFYLGHIKNLVDDDDK